MCKDFVSLWYWHLVQELVYGQFSRKVCIIVQYWPSVLHGKYRKHHSGYVFYYFLFFSPAGTVYLYFKGLFMSRYITRSSQWDIPVSTELTMDVWLRKMRTAKLWNLGDTGGQSQLCSPTWAEQGQEVLELPPNTRALILHKLTVCHISWHNGAHFFCCILSGLSGLIWTLFTFRSQWLWQSRWGLSGGEQHRVGTRHLLTHLSCNQGPDTKSAFFLAGFSSLGLQCSSKIISHTALTHN